MNRLRVGAVAACAAMFACTGGQTGGLQPVHGDPLDQCEPSRAMLDVDSVLPVGYSLRDLVDSVSGESRVQAYWFAETPREGPEPGDADSSTQLSVSVQYTGGDQQAVHDCSGYGNQPHAPVRVTLTTQDGLLDAEYDAFVVGSPDALRLETPHGPLSDQRHGPRRALRVTHSEHGLQGRILGQGGDAVLVFPTACGGYAQPPLDALESSWPLTPSEILAALADLRWSADVGTEQQAIEVNFSPSVTTACYALTSWANATSTPTGTPANIEDDTAPGQQPNRETMHVPLTLTVGPNDHGLSVTATVTLIASPALGGCEPAQSDGGKGSDCLDVALRGCGPATATAALETLVGASLGSPRLCIELRGDFGSTAEMTGQITLQDNPMTTNDEDLPEMEPIPVEATWSVQAVTP